jgi:hypothetical protein
MRDETTTSERDSERIVHGRSWWRRRDHGLFGTTRSRYAPMKIQNRYQRIRAPTRVCRELLGATNPLRPHCVEYSVTDTSYTNWSHPYTQQRVNASDRVGMFERFHDDFGTAHTADKRLAEACARIPPEFGYYDVASRYHSPPQTAKAEFPHQDPLSWGRS